MPEAIDEAMVVLQDTRLSEHQRVDAVHSLAADATPAGIAALVGSLRDGDYGVRWAAGSALAHIGEPAMPALLTALIGPDVDEVLRDGARHVLTDNASPRVRELSVPLIKALKGPQADIAAMQEALKLLAIFR
jgi:HEAT repeat protein